MGDKAENVEQYSNCAAPNKRCKTADRTELVILKAKSYKTSSCGALQNLDLRVHFPVWYPHKHKYTTAHVNTAEHT